MESLAPPLHLCIEVRMALERGDSLHSTLNRILPDLEVEFRQDVFGLLLHFEQYGTNRGLKLRSVSPYRRELLDLIAHGLAGQPIHPRLLEIEKEIKWACDEEIETFIALLPFRALLPLLLIQFPAFLLLLFGPIIQEFTRSFMR